MIERQSHPAAAPPLPAHGARHVAIIMDGNRRWAAEHQLPVAEGHRAGGRALRTVSRAAAAAGVAYLTVYAFSEENWRRDADEVGSLMETIRAFAADETAAMRGERVCVRTIGDIAGLPEATRAAVVALCDATRGNGGLVLTLALNYSARTEIATGIRRLAEDVAAKRLAAAAIDDDVLERYLRTAGLPDPICSSAAAANSASPIFCCTNWPIPSSGRRPCRGRPSTARSSRRLSRSLQPASDASGLDPGRA